MFSKAAALIPADMPLMKDERFTKDREDYTGRSWSKENIERGRPEALVEIKQAFEFLESAVLGDGRKWVCGEELTVADIEGSSYF